MQIVFERNRLYFSVIFFLSLINIIHYQLVNYSGKTIRATSGWSGFSVSISASVSSNSIKFPSLHCSKLLSITTGGLIVNKHCISGIGEYSEYLHEKIFCILFTIFRKSNLKTYIARYLHDT